MSEPLVSICCITYNHERFLPDAIDGFLMQETDFPIEIVIGEDCSTDGTLAIAAAYQKQHPDVIRLVTSEKNVGPNRNLARTIEACRGKYIAVCEGDDYWIHPQKLQKQVDYLEAHPECSMCFHNAAMCYMGGGRAPRMWNGPLQKPIMSLEDLLPRDPAATCTVVFSRECLGQIPAWYHGLAMGDWPLWVLLARRGYVGYLDDVMAVYRIHLGGIYSSKTALQWVTEGFRACDAIETELGSAYHVPLLEMRYSWVHGLVSEFFASRGHATPPRTATRQLRGLLMPICMEYPVLIPRALGELNAMYLFCEGPRPTRAAVSQALAGLGRYDRSYLRNPGIWSVAAQAFLSRRVLRPLRYVARQVCGIGEESL